MQLAFYKGPPTELQHRLAHWLICVLTFSRYSHVELVIDGVCWSSSFRDGGVRPARINLASGHWDVFEVAGDPERALAWFRAHRGEPYDWWGMLRVCPLLRWLPRTPFARFCSEAMAAALGAQDPETFSPGRLRQVYCYGAVALSM